MQRLNTNSHFSLQKIPHCNYSKIKKCVRLHDQEQYLNTGIQHSKLKEITTHG